MTEAQRIADLLTRAVWGEAWHGPGLHDILTDITAAQALAKPIPNAHSIWDLVLHLTAWADIVAKRLAGGRWEEDESWPEVRETDQTAWDATRAAAEQSHDRLAAVIRTLSEARLAELMPGEPPMVYIQLHGLIQHSLYHLGQIALLKKASSTGRA
ncbi:MAG: DinB family protein [Candidatus Latescibacteria bacterium]|nr:DinB family protein [Candidatus Latescibacterota bacterium]